MTFDEYQKKARKTAIYSHFGGAGWVYPALGLTSEAGEVAGKFKKIIRDNDGKMPEDARQAIKGELGDVLWYISQLAYELDFSLEEIAELNVKKLSSRYKRRVIKGKGDNR